ncbi:MAG TPA: putative sulfate exporter family transporter [Acidimicrobiales bacterium]|nr:putative sulfate exporter family transporter [Acidimicrobiales bacterium]
MGKRMRVDASNTSLRAQVAPGRTRLERAAALLPGLAPVVVLTAVATALGHLVPVVGAPVFAVLGGIGVALVRLPAPRARPGLGFAARTVLKTSIVVLGTGLSFHEVLTIGGSSLPVLLGTLAVALLGSVVAGTTLGVARDLRTLIGVGTGICGASAIAATDAVISASDADVSYAIATIFTFNVAAVLSFPTIGHALGLSPHAFGLWAGTAVNDLSSVVAASTIFGHGATSYAVVVKLTRTLMIIPITLVLSGWRTRPASTDGRGAGAKLRDVVPAFIGWFLVAVALNTIGLVPTAWHQALSPTAEVMITAALGAIGLSTRPRDVRRAGLRPLALGAVLWVLVAATSLALQML